MLLILVTGHLETFVMNDFGPQLKDFSFVFHTFLVPLYFEILQERLQSKVLIFFKCNTYAINIERL